MLKRIIAVSACLLAFISLSAQNNLSAEDWRSDLRWFQQTVHTKYPNLFYNVTAARFDSAVDAIDKKIGTLSDLQMKVEFSKLVAMFHIGHTLVRALWNEGNSFNAWVRPLPVRFYLFDDGLYIKAIHADYKEAVGGKVLKLGNKKTEEALELIRPVMAYENEQGYKNMLQFYLNLPEILQAVGITEDAAKVSISYLKDGKEKTISLPAQDAMPMHHFSPLDNAAGWVDAYGERNQPGSVLWMKKPEKLRYFEYLPKSKTVYVRHSGVQDEPDETIREFFEKVFNFIDSNDVDRFVLDIRLNGGGNNYLNKPVITGIIGSKKINRKGHLFVILGKATFSAAQNLTNELEKYTECIFVGEPTSENVNFYGDTRTEVLPKSKLNIALSWLWWQNLDPRDKRPWTAPRVATDMTFADYQQGNDPAMNAIMNYKSQGSVEEQIRTLAENKKYEEALVVAQKYLADPQSRYYRNGLENFINNYGYELLGKNANKEAKNVLELNTRLFPSSANAFDSYAEACWKSGETKEAIRNYEIAISKDPSGPTGENSRRMLEQVKKGF